MNKQRTFTADERAVIFARYAPPEGGRGDPLKSIARDYRTSDSVIRTMLAQYGVQRNSEAGPRTNYDPCDKPAQSFRHLSPSLSRTERAQASLKGYFGSEVRR